MRNIFSAAAILFTLLIFTFYIDGEIGVIVMAFLIFAPLVSLFFALYGRSRVKISFDCDGYVKKNSRLKVRVSVEKNGRFPLGIIEIQPDASEVFGSIGKVYRLSMITADKKSFEIEVDAVTGGNGEISVVSAYSCGFMGFLKFRIRTELPPAKSVGVIPEIPDVKSSSQLFRSIADAVLTSDDEENNDTSMLFSASTTIGYEHREYVAGDPLKRVNWKLSQKKGTLMVRLDEAAASVQPVIAFDLYRSSTADPKEAVIDEERLISSVFGLLSMLIKQGVSSTFLYYSADGSVISESVDNPDFPPQLLLKVLASKVETDRRIRIADTSACACVLASTDCSADISGILSSFENKENVSLIGISAESKNETEYQMWYLDGDNNFKLV